MSRALLLLLLAGGSCKTVFVGPQVEVEHVEQVAPTGVRWQDVVTGVGRRVRPSDSVTIHYTARLDSGERIDSTHDRGEPEFFSLQAAPVLGWLDAIPGMRRGGKRRITVPPHRAFGDEGVEGLIPPGATLEFLVELVSLQRQP